MKKIIALFVAIVMTCIPVGATEVVLYNADGEKIITDTEREEDLRAQGWTDFADVYTTVYSEDGRKADALKSQIEQWRTVGWYDDINDVQTTLYSEDGRSLTVWNSQVEAQLSVGWYKTLGEVQTTLYSEDGRSLTVWNSQVEAQLSVGWYKTLSEVQTTIYNKKGEKKTVWNSEVQDYLANGWSTSPQGVDTSKPMIAITFDDGPGPYTDKILDCLEKYNAKATFFVVGNRLEKYPSQLKREAALGMEIGCHSWSHAQLTKLDKNAVYREIFNTNNKVKEITGVSPVILRPPYGSCNETVKSVADFPVILWSIDTLDWKTKNADSTYNAVMNNVKDGDIILMHDIHAATADAALRLIPALVEKGYQLVTVSQLGQYKKGGLSPSVAYSKIK